MLERKGFVGVKDAAAILDVAPNTIRAWGAAGKITEYRHPANNYRLYKRADLERLIRELTHPFVPTKEGKREKGMCNPRGRRAEASHLGLGSGLSTGQSMSEAS